MDRSWGCGSTGRKTERAVPEELREEWDVGHLKIQPRTTAYLAYGDAVYLPSKGSWNLQRWPWVGASKSKAVADFRSYSWASMRTAG